MAKTMATFGKPFGAPGFSIFPTLPSLPQHLLDTLNGVCNANSTKVQPTTKAKEEIVVVILVVGSVVVASTAAAVEPNSARAHWPRPRTCRATDKPRSPGENKCMCSGGTPNVEPSKYGELTPIALHVHPPEIRFHTLFFGCCYTNFL